MTNPLPRDVEEQLARDQVDALHRLPGAWWYQGILLLLAADNMAPAIRSAEQRQRNHALNGTGTQSGQLTPEETANFFQVGTKAVWTMLNGLAVENLLKALTAAKLKIEPQGGRHKLQELAGAVLVLQSDEAALLLELSHYVRWRGRYMAPREIKEYLAHERQTQGVGFRYWQLEEAQVRIRAFVARIEAELEACGHRRPG